MTEPTSNKSISRKDIFDYAWKHFDVIADQRLRTFNFYVILLAASIGASLAAVRGNPNSFVFLVIGFFCIAIGIIFFLIEVRTRRLLEIPKNVLTILENDADWPEDLRLFNKDNFNNRSWKKRLISYTIAFRSAFVLHICYGVLFVILYFYPNLNPAAQSNTPQTAHVTNSAE